MSRMRVGRYGVVVRSQLLWLIVQVLIQSSVFAKLLSDEVSPEVAGW
jgi:hypothetical protein